MSTATKTPSISTAEAEVADLRVRMLRKKFFLITTKRVVPQEEADKYLRAHLLNQIRLEQEGILFGAGPVTDQNGQYEYGMFIIRASSFEEAKRIADDDPMHKAGCRQYTLHQWSLNEGRITVTLDVSQSEFRLG